MKRALLLMLLQQLFFLGYAQQAEIVENAEVSQYLNKSYLVVGGLKLKPGFTVSASQNGTFYARTLESQQSESFASDGYNFVRTELVVVPGALTDDDVIGLLPGDKTTSFGYYDGWGRAIQSVAVQASPDRKDWIQPSYFDSKNRPSRSHLPYKAATGDGSYRTGALAEQATYYASPPTGIPGNTQAYASIAFEDSPLERVLSTTQVGSEFQNKFETIRMNVNDAGAIRKWGVVLGLPRSSGTYPAATLAVSEKTDAEGTRVREYVDSRGRKVLSEVEATASNWLKTYYVYNDFGEMVFMVPPEAAAIFTPNQAQVDLWAYQYQYDNLGRPIATKGPGKGWTYTIFDQWDRPVLSQGPDNRLRNSKEWNFIKYDIHNRPIVTGTFVTTLEIGPLRTAVNLASVRDEIRTNNSIGYTLNRTYPTTVTSTHVLGIKYYDDYSFLGYSGWDAEGKSFAYSTPSGFTNTLTTGTVKGQVTGSKSRTTESITKWQHSVTYFDRDYLPIQVVSGHQFNGVMRSTTAYAFSGEVTESLTEYTGSIGTHGVRYRHTYDHEKRPLEIFHTYNSDPEILLSSTTYNELGQPILAEMGSRDGGENYFYTFSQKYTSQGWLKELDYRMPATNDEIFKETLGYNQDIGTGGSARFDGMISSMSGLVTVLGLEAAFNYSYDRAGRLLATDTKMRPIGESIWTNANVLDENQITYSDNGNILSLSRKMPGLGTPPVIDQLNYTYSGNQLSSVTDLAVAPAKSFGFLDGNISGADYSYNTAGNLIEDKNKGMTAITYNLQDLPHRVDFSNGSNVQYFYNASGGRFKEIRNIQGATTLTRDYVGELELEDGVVKYVNHPFGQLAVETGKYRYNMVDHLGNNWVVLQETPDMFGSAATFEDEVYESESQQFIGYEGAMRVAEPLFDHTKKGNSEFAIRVSGGRGENIGIAKAVHVLPGDTVRMEAFGKYLDLDKKKMTPMLVSMVGALASSGISAGVDGGVVATGRGLSENASPFAGALVKSTQNGDAPPAFLNYLFFDKDKNYKHGGFVQLSEAAREDGTNVAHERLYQEMVAEEPGYFYIYLSNDSQEASEAFFDDFSVQVSESPFIQGTLYYSYGLIAMQEVREGEEETRHLFQTKNWDNETGWYDFHARQYDPALGRWLSLDPQNQFASPYLAMGNNPVMMVDPDGELAWFVPIIIGAVVNTAIQGATGNINNFGDFALSMGIGALSGAAGWGAGQLVSGALGASATLGGSILNGTISGAASGFAGGFVGGAGSAWAGGESFKSGLAGGLHAGGFGAIAGGAMGGVAAGIRFSKQTAIFRKSYGKLGIQSSSDPVPATDDFLNRAQQTWYPDAPMDKVVNFTVENVPNNYLQSFAKNGAAARTVPLSKGGVYTGNSNVYFNKNVIFNSAKDLFFTMGHEFIHVSQIASLGGLADNLISQPGFVDILEYHASSYEHSVLNNPLAGGYSPADVRSLMNQFPSYFQQLSYMNFPWSKTANFIYPFK